MNERLSQQAQSCGQPCAWSWGTEGTETQRVDPGTLWLNLSALGAQRFLYSGSQALEVTSWLPASPPLLPPMDLTNH